MDTKRLLFGFCVMLCAIACAQDMTDLYMAQFNQQLMMNAQMMNVAFQQMQAQNAQYAKEWQQIKKEAQGFLEDIELMSTEERQAAYKTWRKRIAKLEMVADGGEQARREFARRCEAFSIYREDIGLDCGVYIDRTNQQMMMALNNLQQARMNQQAAAQKQMSDQYNQIRNNSPAKYNEHRCQFCGDTYYGPKCPCRTVPKYSGTYRDKIIYEKDTGKVIDIIY